MAAIEMGHKGSQRLKLSICTSNSRDLKLVGAWVMGLILVGAFRSQ